VKTSAWGERRPSPPLVRARKKRGRGGDLKLTLNAGMKDGGSWAG